MKYHILMADVIQSIAYNGHALINTLKEITKIINTRYRNQLLSPLTITLGDEFQGVMSSFEAGIETIISLEEIILKHKKVLKLRYILNYGEIDTPINRKYAHEMMGEGLVEARNILENSKKNDNRFMIKDDNEKLSNKINLGFAIFQSFVDNWKERDYEVISAFIEHKDYKLVAKDLRKTASLMWKRKRSLKIDEYFIIKELIFLLANEYKCNN